MKILICNERFLFRFGVDRVLIILGKGLKALGHTIYLMGNRFDSDIVSTFASRIFEVPSAGESIEQNEFTLAWLQQNWGQMFDNATVPDLVLIGGWPFLPAIRFFREKGCKVVFSDHGVVPLDGYAGYHLSILNKLKSLKHQYLKYSSAVIGVSDFIIRSQSYADAGNDAKVLYILNGADHLEMDIWPALELHLKKPSGSAIKLLTSLKNRGKKLILFLGRWETNCYKNSEASFDIMSMIKKDIPDCALLVLSRPSDINIPQGLRDVIYPIGFPDDNEMADIMRRSDLGISVSLWEGFNLPIAEMQWLDRPVLAFNIGAHPEVILHPWYLCGNNGEMATKARDILCGSGPNADSLKQHRERFHDYFKWSRVVHEYIDTFEKLVKGDALDYKGRITLILDVTNAARDPANSGVIRVTRRLGRELQRYLDPVFVVWDEGLKSYVLPTKGEYQTLGSFNGPLLTEKSALSPDGRRVALGELLPLPNAWLFFPETVDETRARKARRFARENGIRLAAIFHDAIPVMYPDLCKDASVRDNHRGYMIGLAECDVIIPNSSYSAGCLKKFWEDNAIEGCLIAPDLLPGEFGGFGRATGEKEYRSNRADILCVSTLEPRKNHGTLIKSCLLMQENHPELEWSLTLVGNRYAGASDIADYVQDISAKNPRIKWLGVVDDATLHRLYDGASLTVYPSMVEGFGMPILESIWHGRPCICHEEGAMSELAAEGGCLTTNVRDERVLSEAIYRLATDAELSSRLSREAVARKIKTWDDYVRELMRILGAQNASVRASVGGPAISAYRRDWQEVLYPACLCDGWQMNHSERLAITAILSRCRPACSIEIGTYLGGSLSLISQYSDVVFSLDIDPTVSVRLRHFRNVSFITGPSSVTLPLLFKALDEKGIPVDFILIDGDHSAMGVKRDIDSILSYVPKKPLFVVMHDSFNPECRKGMLEADWAKSRYVHWVDIDLIPGRVIEHDGPSHGEIWGGMALAYFLPVARKGPLCVNTSAGMMFERILHNDPE